MKEITNSSNIEILLLDYFRQKGKQIDPKQDLFECGALDSLGVMELIVFLEESLNFDLAHDSMRIENFRSIESISKTISRNSCRADKL